MDRQARRGQVLVGEPAANHSDLELPALCVGRSLGALGNRLSYRGAALVWRWLFGKALQRWSQGVSRGLHRDWTRDAPGAVEHPVLYGFSPTFLKAPSRLERPSARRRVLVFGRPGGLATRTGAAAVSGFRPVHLPWFVRYHRAGASSASGDARQAGSAICRTCRRVLWRAPRQLLPRRLLPGLVVVFASDRRGASWRYWHVCRGVARWSSIAGRSGVLQSRVLGRTPGDARSGTSRRRHEPFRKHAAESSVGAPFASLLPRTRRASRYLYSFTSAAVRDELFPTHEGPSERVRQLLAPLVELSERWEALSEREKTDYHVCAAFGPSQA